MAQTKPLFVPWLYEQIQSGKYPGVCWKNKERTTFSIPWKHALRQDSNNDDGLIFKAWAQTTSRDGKINEDHCVWKRNFRSALRAKGFRMILDNKNDAANPHKVYIFPTESNSAGSERSQENDDSQELYLGDEEVFTTLPSHDLDSCFLDLNLQDSSTQEESHRGLDWHEGFVGQVEEELYQETSPFATPQFTKRSSTEMVHSVQECYRTSAAISGLEQTEMGQFEAAERTDETAQYYPDGEHVGNQAANYCATGTLETFFQIKVYYKGKMMLDHLLENDAGFRLVYQGSMDSSAMESTVPVVNLPSPDNIHDQMQATLTKEILENLGGLELRRSDGVVLSHRWGKSKVFWGLCKHEKSQRARELSKNTPEVIYLFKDYISGLMEFIKNNSGPSPSYTLYFFLGEKWPDPKMKPWEKKLIMIEVVLTSLEDLKMMAVARGASSLQSMELQVSLEQMMELC
ncbi:interferon regulatory factor 3 [Triplophysa rosa]|uniref:Interferon regulatory factor 3 n=1 Tax=Triplophysa rosa TaxID=992332 RepID=A0A9W7WGB0_TRIRA|nr:interferon regulatory factor 3 [Triplophysa rosa]XP_057215373.1 interferon regulatory factor 3 [Triplophysa rosa]KAI7796578.1 interferon regulatory factor 3 [Triplophysa rosa]